LTPLAAQNQGRRLPEPLPAHARDFGRRFGRVMATLAFWAAKMRTPGPTCIRCVAACSIARPGLDVDAAVVRLPSPRSIAFCATAAADSWPSAWLLRDIVSPSLDSSSDKVNSFSWSICRFYCNAFHLPVPSAGTLWESHRSLGLRTVELRGQVFVTLPSSRKEDTVHREPWSNNNASSSSVPMAIGPGALLGPELTFSDLLPNASSHILASTLAVSNINHVLRVVSAFLTTIVMRPRTSGTTF
jgi:hypothetical protein